MGECLANKKGMAVHYLYHGGTVSVLSWNFLLAMGKGYSGFVRVFFGWVVV